MAKHKARDGRREAYWRRVVRGQRQSGLTIREFCRDNNLPESAFYFWRRELERRQAEQERPRRRKHPTGPAVTSAPPAFVAVRLTEQAPPPAEGRIEIVLPGERRVQVRAPVNRQALADVLAVLSLESDAGGGEDRPC